MNKGVLLTSLYFDRTALEPYTICTNAFQPYFSRYRSYNNNKFSKTVKQNSQKHFWFPSQMAEQSFLLNFQIFLFAKFVCCCIIQLIRVRLAAEL